MWNASMKTFDLLSALTTRARISPRWLWVLNKVLGWTIPFNRPHGFRILEIGDHRVRTTASYKRSNHNHVRGIHACAIATVAEFSAGFLLLMNLDPKRYRLIMSHLEVTYLYQAKEQIISESFLSSEDLVTDVMSPLQEHDSITIRIESKVRDVSENDIAIAYTTWQIKGWDRVHTRV